MSEIKGGLLELGFWGNGGVSQRKTERRMNILYGIGFNVHVCRGNHYYLRLECRYTPNDITLIQTANDKSLHQTLDFRITKFPSTAPSAPALSSRGT